MMMSKEQILKHIQAARLWLDKAQDFVEKNNVIRGLSFLFLASAETQMPLRESQKAAGKTAAGKTAPRMRPAYSAALAASVTFIVAFAGWRIVMKSNQPLTAQRIPASEFVARMKVSNARGSIKASSLLEETLNALQQQIEESKPVKKSSRWVAFHTPKKVRYERKRDAATPVHAKHGKTIKEAAVEKTAGKPAANENEKEGKIISAPETESDLFGLVKIAEKTLKGQ